jgi:TrmH family RNA methyltransferase
MNKKTVRIIKKDNDFQKFEVLMRNRNKRHQYQEFIVEGVRNVNNAIKYNWDVKGVIYSSETKKSEWANNIINNSQIKVAYDLTSNLLEALSDKEESSEIMLLVGYSTHNIINELNTKNPIVAIFDRPSNRGNLGTVIRSCEAMGVSGLAISGHSVDLYDPETISSSTGSFFKLPIGGSASSLNVACATSIILYEIQRQRNYLDIICEN